MKTKLMSKFNMSLSLREFLNKNQKIWESVSELDKAVKKLNHNIDSLKEIEGEIVADLGEVKSKKITSRKALISEAMPVINILRAYSNECKAKDLHKKSNLSKRKLEKSKDSNLVEHVKTIWKESKKLYNKTNTAVGVPVPIEDGKTNIRNYGLSNQMIENLKEVIEIYKESCLAYTQAKSKKDRHIIEFKSLIKKNETLMKNKIDLLVSIFETSKPDFYKNYLKTREVLKESKGRNSKKPNSNKDKKQVEGVKTVQVPENKMNELIPTTPKTTIPEKKETLTNMTVKKPVSKKPVAAKRPIVSKKKPVPVAKTTKPLQNKTDEKPKV